MRKKIFSISDLKPAYQKVRRSLAVVIGGIMIAVSAVASRPIPTNDLQYCDVSPEKTIIVDTTIIPTTFIEEASIKAEKDYNWIEETFSEMATFDDDWDGEGARAISPAALENARNIMDKTHAFKSKLQEIYPTPFGSVCLEWNFNGVFINAEVGANVLAFYKDSGNDTDIHHERNAISNETIEELIACLDSSN